MYNGIPHLFIPVVTDPKKAAGALNWAVQAVSYTHLDVYKRQVVPTGNFGNILAAYYAKQMGLPVHKLICASNDNKVLYDFLRTAVSYTHLADF